MKVSSKGPHGSKVTMTKPVAEFKTGLANSLWALPIESDAHVR